MNTKHSSLSLRAGIAGLFIYSLSFTGLVFAHHTPVPTLAECLAAGKKITICHATSSATNPYEEISISCNALYGNNGNAGHFDENGTPHAGHEEDFVLADGETCETAHATPSPSPSPSATPEPSVTPAPSATPNPTGTPNSTPDPSSTPNPTNDPSTQPHSALSSLDLSCGTNEFTSVMELQQPVGNRRSGVTVHFTFQGQSKSAVTNSEGRAIVYFGRQNGTLTAQADNFPSQSLFVTAPTNCPDTPSNPGDTGTGGGNQGGNSGSSNGSTSGSGSSGSNTGSGRGQVLGATTLAETGSTKDLMLTLASFGLPLVLAFYAFQKITR